MSARPRSRFRSAHGGRFLLLVLLPLLAFGPVAAGAADGEPTASAESPIVAPAGPSVSPFDSAALAPLIAQALAANPSLVELSAALEAARARVEPAKTLPDPMLSLAYQNGDNRPSLGRDDNNYLAAMWTQTWVTRTKRDLAGQMAEAGAGRSEAELRRGRLTLAAEVRRAWAELVVARAVIDVLAEQRERWEALGQAARSAYETGTGMQADLLRAQTELTRIEQMRLHEEGSVGSALARMNRLLARPGGTPLDTPAPLASLEASLLPLAPLDELLRAAETASPELDAARRETDLGRSAAELATKNRWPDVSFSGTYMSRGALGPMFAIGVSAPIPIFASKRQASMIAEGRAMERSAAARVEDVRLRLRASIESNRAELLSSLAEAEAYRNGILVQDRAVVDSIFASFRSGRATLTTLLQAQETLLVDTRDYISRLAHVLWHAAGLYEFALETPPAPWS